MPTAVNNNIPKGVLLSTKPIVLWIHDPAVVYNHDAVVNPDMFPSFQDGQLLRIHCPQQQQQQQQQQQNSQTNSNAKKQDHQELNKLDTHSSSKQASSEQQQQQQQKKKIEKSDMFDNDSTHLQFDSVIVKGHAIDKEGLAKQQQLQVTLT